MDLKLGMGAFALLLTLTLIVTGVVVSDSDNEVQAISGADLDSTCTIQLRDTNNFTETWTVMETGYFYLPATLSSFNGEYIAEWREGSRDGEAHQPGERIDVEGDMIFYVVYDERPTDRDYRHETSLDSTLSIGVPYSYVPFTGHRNATGIWDIYDDLDFWMTYNANIKTNADWLDYRVEKNGSFINSIVFEGTPTHSGLFYVTVNLEKVRTWGSTIHASSYFYFELYVPSIGDATYTVSYNTNGGTGVSINADNNIHYNTVIELPTGRGLVNGDQTLVRWSIDESNQGYTEFPLGGIYVVTEDVTANAVWEDNPHVIIYNPLGAEGVTASIGFSEDMRELSTDPGTTLEGYDFAGWIIETSPGQVYAPGYVLTMPSADIMLVGYWIPEGAETCTVMFNPNGGDGMGSQVVEPGTTIVLPAQGYSYKDHTFNGWVTSTDGSGMHYEPGALFTVESDITLYADWTENVTEPEDPDDPEAPIVYYNVTFLPGSESAISYNPVPVRSGDVVSEPLPRPYRYDGYAFDYWSSPSGEYDFGTPVTSDLVLTANWIQIATLSYDEDDPSKVYIIPEDPSYNLRVSWGDGDTDEGSGTMEHDYGRTFHGTINVTWIQASTSSADWPTTMFSVHAVDAESSGQETIVPVADINSVSYEAAESGQITLYMDATTTTNATAWHWYLNGTLIATGQTATYQADLQPGEYTVTLVAVRGLSDSQDTFDFTVEALEEPDDPDEPVDPDDPNNPGGQEPTDPDDPVNPGDPDDPVIPGNPDDPAMNEGEINADFTIEQVDGGWRFDASNSTGNIVGYIWTLDGQEVSTDRAFTFTESLSDGEHRIVLVVYESQEIYDTADGTFNVGDSGDGIDIVTIAVIVVIILIIILVALRFGGVI